MQDPHDPNVVNPTFPTRQPLQNPWDDITVAGVTFGNRQEVIKKLKVGDPLYMFADPYGRTMGQVTGDMAASKHNDPNAVMLCHFDHEAQKYEPVGYVPKVIASNFVQALANVPAYNTLQGRVRAVVGGPERGRESYGLRVDLPNV